MVRDTDRRDGLAEAATDYVLDHGLIGLSLRPLAAALGTSDRMLLYHFGSKDDLVATVLRVSNDRAVVAVRALEPARDVRTAVRTSADGGSALMTATERSLEVLSTVATRSSLLSKWYSSIRSLVPSAAASGRRLRPMRPWSST